MAVNEPADIEAGPLEVAAQPYPARIDEVDDGRDDLGLARGVLGDGLHQIEQSHVLGHRVLSFRVSPLTNCAPDSVTSRRTSARKLVNPLSDLMRAIRPEVTCSMRPSMRRGGCARASRWSTNARWGDSSSARGPGTRSASN